MRRAPSRVVLLAVLGTIFVATDARADGPEDPWFGPDKVIHYGVSAGIAGSGYVVGAMIFDTRAHALAVGASRW